MYLQPSAVSTYSSSPSTKASDYAHDVRVYHQPSPNASGFIQEERRSQALASSVWTDGDRAQASTADYDMDESADPELSDEYPMDIHCSPTVQEFPNRPHIVEPMHDAPNGIHVHDVVQSQGNKLGKLGSLGFGKKRSGWGLGGMFGGDKSHQNGLPPLEEIAVASTSTPSLKRSQTASSDSKSLREPSPVPEPPLRHADAKKNKKEAERIQREAEKQRRALAVKMQREQARAVMQKRNQMTQDAARQFEWDGWTQQRLEWDEKGKQAASGPVRQNQAEAPATTLSAAAGRFVPQSHQPEGPNVADWRRDTERMAKARRREFDDDHSMSSSDVHSLGRMSMISFATVDSDPGPSRIRNRPSLLGMSRMASSSSLQTSFDEFGQEFSPSTRSSFSPEPDGQLTGNISPPPMQTLSLSPSLSPSQSPWLHPQPDGRGFPYPQHSPRHPRTSPMNGEFNGSLLHSPYGHPPSPGVAPKSAINPMFQVVRSSL